MSSSTPGTGGASRPGPRFLLTALVAVLVGATACAPSSRQGDADAARGSAIPSAVVDDPADFDLDALVAAAKKEGSVTVYDSSGDITKVAEAFTAKYGIKATGVKNKVGDTLEKMTREAQADNVTIDMTLYEDGPSLVGKLLPQKVVHTWIPADLADQVPAANRSPLLVLSKANVWVYNPKLFPKGCPVDNIWDLAGPGWRGKVALQDPLGKPNIIEWFNQLSNGADQALRDAHSAAHPGEELKTSQRTAAQEWVVRLAKNSPVLTSADDDVAAAVASPNQTQPRIGLVSNAKFRDVEEKNYSMRVCDTLKPWSGYLYPKYSAIATKTTHPNAAKLFTHFILTEEGISHEMGAGGISGSTAVKQGSFSPPGLSDWKKELFSFDPKFLAKNFADTEAMQDLWRLSHS
ncbi:ABC transporter substrate-binding protein [Streptomyces lancefieldiae]|uniref:ABC transporter substrate-binding protein n=1 Tax=Streptomyces lancefieldiae TaxID=3075520 RepID=A0ABU3AG01_9ACTN|nr:ABC transporter substrate-binding protein [Streptomyces sp. DSM 40712]MDT0609102.1 ABC transporter substrate-binding protein [Streptomyces sp. DSM 40712]